MSKLVPSEKAIEAAKSTVYSSTLGYSGKDIADTRREWLPLERALEAVYAIDVDPLLDEKDAEIEAAKSTGQELFRALQKAQQRITELEARVEEESGLYVDTLNSRDEKIRRIAELESALRQQQEECDRFHKLA